MNHHLLPPPNPGIVWVSVRSTDTASHVLIAAKSGQQFVITDLVVCNAHATVNAGVTLKGPLVDIGPLPAASAFGGCCLPINTPIPLPDGTDLAFVSSANADVTVTVGGYWAFKGGY